ncbi:MAG: transporter substrate-binding domain-containing protein, partial [Betaproteobacteria bacterium]
AKMGGLGIDILKAIEGVDPEIKFVYQEAFTPMKRLENDLETGDIDCFVRFLKNERRLAVYNFIDIPAFITKAKLAVRSDDNIEIKSKEDIAKLGDDGVVLSLFGTAYAEYVSKQPGWKTDTNGKTIGQVYQMLTRSRGRFFYYHDIGLIYARKVEGLEGKVKLLPFVVNEEAQYMACSKKVPQATVGKVAAALKKLSDTGKLLQIQEKYTK